MHFPDHYTKTINDFLPLAQQKAFLESLAENPVTSLRLNPFKPLLHLPYSPMCAVPWCQYGHYLLHRPSFVENPTFWTGAFYVQEASSMFIEQVFKKINPKKPIKVLDLSAAPGGKSTHLLSLISPESLLVSNEIDKHRVEALIENLARWGGENYIVTQSTPQALGRLTSFFDIILVDAPCSGEGMFRKDRQVAKNWSIAHVAFCAKKQQEILGAILPALSNEGYLIYSTCTFNRKENEENLHWLCDTFGLKSVRIPLQSEWGVIEVEEKNRYAYRFFPHLLKGEGFFITCLQKNTLSGSKKTGKKNVFQEISEDAQKSIREWLTEDLHGKKLYSYQEHIFLLFPTHNTWITQIADQAYIKQTALKVGKWKAKSFVPSNELAYSRLVSKQIERRELNEKEALNFLSKKELPTFSSNKEWILATYQGLGLGWLKKVGERFNNHYPSAWKIRKILE